MEKSVSIYAEVHMYVEERFKSLVLPQKKEGGDKRLSAIIIHTLRKTEKKEKKRTIYLYIRTYSKLGIRVFLQFFM